MKKKYIFIKSDGNNILMKTGGLELLEIDRTHKYSRSVILIVLDFEMSEA